MINDYFKVGDEVTVPGLKDLVTINFVGPVTVLGKGKHGGKYGFVQNDHDNLIYCLTPKKNKVCMNISILLRNK
jgi:hypothetical protein